MKNKTLKRIVDFYLKSYDYNGIPINQLFENITEENIIELKELIINGKITINWGYPHPNPHIQAYRPLEIDKQVKWLNELKIEELISKKPPILEFKKIIIQAASEKDFCIYPTKKVLINAIDKNKYKNRPLERKLALAEHQFKPYFFDLSVLDDYMNDPRYHFQSDGIKGRIYIKKDNTIPKKDDLYVEHFSYGIRIDNEQYERCVAVFLHDLKHLSPNQQQRWMTKLIRSKKFFLHPEYEKMSRGSWDTNLSIFQAFIEELRIINTMFLKAYGKKILKHDEFTDQELSHFHFILRPTDKQYYEFVHLLDKLISDNINKAFFNENFKEKVKKENNSVEPGTLLLLDKWLDSKVKVSPPEDKIEMIRIFKYIRNERQKPGHRLSKNEWNKKYWTMQRKLIIDAYTAIRTLRLIIASHRLASNVEVPEWLYKGEICTY